jgi:hypothetical protein
MSLLLRLDRERLPQSVPGCRGGSLRPGDTLVARQGGQVHLDQPRSGPGGSRSERSCGRRIGAFGDVGTLGAVRGEKRDIRGGLGHRERHLCGTDESASKARVALLQCAERVLVSPRVLACKREQPIS